MIEIRRVRDPRQEKLDEVRDAGIRQAGDLGERNEALLEYVAMMCDVELPEEGDDE